VDKKLKELQRRLANEEIKNIESKSKARDMGKIRSYASQEQVPAKKLRPGQLFVDQEHETVLVPVKPNVFAPFHISTIKNVSTQATGNYVYLRLNFFVPGGSSMQFPDSQAEN